MGVRIGKSTATDEKKSFKFEKIKMLWGVVKDGGMLSTGPNKSKFSREDSVSSMLEVSSLSSESNDSFTTNRRSSQFSDIVPYLDEETQDALYYQDEDESTFTNVPLLSLKLEKEISYLFPPSTILIGLLQTLKKVSAHLLDISDNEPYGVKGAKVILKIKYSNGTEDTLGSFAVDPNTVSTFEITLTLKQESQFGTSLRSWLGSLTNGTKTMQISPHYTITLVDLYRSARKSVTFHI